MHKIIALFLCCIFSNNGFSQIEEPVDTLWTRPFYLKTTPFSFWRIYRGAAVTLSVEYFLKNKHSLQLEIGLEQQSFALFGDYKNLRGINASPSFIFNFIETIAAKRTTFTNVAISIDYGQSEYTRTDSFETTLPPIPVSQMYTYDSKRFFIGSSAKVGVKTVFRKGFLIEFFFGAGFIFNSIQTDLPYSLATKRYFGDWTVPKNYTQMKGCHIMPTFSAGFKIGYGFKKRDK